jgi:membrane fusion protein (multidrug efflux system)
MTVSVLDNQRVKQGDVLVRLDPADHRSRVEAARANLELQRANLRQAERDLTRSKALYDQAAGSADRYDKAVSAQETAAAQVKLAAEQLRQAELNLGYTPLPPPRTDTSRGSLFKQAIMSSPVSRSWQ